MAKSDLDLQYKLQFRKLLHLMGYYSPVEVELSHYDPSGANAKRSALTDLDVLGISYDGIFTAHRIIGDCKSGSNVSEASRLFWLRGLVDYFGADQAYLIKTTLDAHARALAPKLGLRVLDKKELGTLAASLRADKYPIPLEREDLYAAREELLTRDAVSFGISSEDAVLKRRTLQFVSYGFWYYDRHRSLLQLLNDFSLAAHLLLPDRDSDVLLAHVGLERFAMCILDLCGAISSRGLTDIARGARTYIYGGPIQMREREEFVRLINKMAGANEQLDPGYLNDLLDTVLRTMQNPRSSSKALHYLETLYVWCIQLGHPTLETAYQDRFDVGTVVTIRDFAITFSRAAGLNEALFAKVLSM